MAMNMLEGAALSVVIPTLNEAETLPRLLASLRGDHPLDVLVVDGGSRDGTRDIARRFGVPVLQAEPGRARQLNRGAAATHGEWLWFLHADSILPPDWADQLHEAMAAPRLVGGAFRVRIAALGLRYRVLDGWGWLRSALCRTCYGDQGLFVRRPVFERLGGFDDLPALEDLAFSERMRRAGPVALLRGPIRTSARRWERHGWWRTVGEHSAAVIRYHLRRDRRRVPACAPVAGPIHVVVMAKAPIPGRVKTRLTPPLTGPEAAQLARALLEDTAGLVSRIPGTRMVVAVEPSDATPLVQAIVPRVEVVPQTSGDLGTRMAAVIADRCARGASAVLLIGSDAPTVPRGHVERAVGWLRQGDDQLVVGPAEDGGYYLIGLTRPHPELFGGIAWGGPGVLQATLERAAISRLPVRRLAPWHDVDMPGDLTRLRQELADRPQAAPATAHWLQQHV